MIVILKYFVPILFGWQGSVVSVFAPQNSVSFTFMKKTNPSETLGIIPTVALDPQDLYTPPFNEVIYV